MVHRVEKLFHEIRGEMDRWRDILAVPYHTNKSLGLSK